MTIAWGYLVVSSDKQVDTIEHQRAWVVDTAKSKGWHLERCFEGVATGKHGPRSIIQGLLDEVRQADVKPDWILMIRLDRVGRGSIAESQFLLHELHSLGVRIWTRDAGEEKNDTATDEFIRAAKLFTARHENDIRKEKAAAAHARKRREGKHAGHAPYGTVLIDGKPVPYEPEAQIVREIFSRRLTGWGTHRLARYAATHAPPKKTASGGTRKLKWGENTIGRMLSCETYKGTVVDADLWLAVQGIKHPGIDRSAKYPWPLRGAVRCSCGHMLSTSYSGTSKRIRYYTCRNIAVHGNYPYHRADELERQFVDLMRELLIDPSLFYEDVEPDLEPLKERAKSLEQEIKDLAQRRIKVWELGETGAIEPSEIAQRIAELGQARKEAERQLGEMKRTLALSTGQHSRYNVSALIAQMIEDWPHAQAEEQREVAKAVAEIVGGLYVDPARKNTLQRMMR